jgi:hypothetical protein
MREWALDGSAMSKTFYVGVTNLAVLTVVGLLSNGSAIAAGKIYHGSRVGMTVTIKSMTGLDTPHAAIQTEHTREDAIEFCREYVGENPVTEKCVKQEVSVPLNDAIYADCPKGVFTDFAGDKYLFKGKNLHQGETGPKYFLLNLRTRQIADGSSASGYDVNMDIFRALRHRTAPPPER